MKQKRLSTAWVLLLILSLLLAACVAPQAPAAGSGAAAAPESTMMQAIGEGEGEVAIVAWAGYIERGETDPNFDWVTEFEAETGCKVTVKTAATSD
jgi:putative spermidine/putrescine transport system substrate-binding protein